MNNDDRSATMVGHLASLGTLRRGAPTRAGGFTLLELLIAMAVLGILAAIAIPSYTQYVQRGKRAEARAALMDIAARQERHYSDNYKYSKTLSALGIGSTFTESGNYLLKVAVGSTLGDSYSLSAEPQFADDECQSLTLDHVGTKGVSKSGGSVKDCWGR